MIAAASLIKAARTAADLTQSELADLMGTTQSVVARLESPHSNPRLDTIHRALAAAGHDLDAHLRAVPPAVDETMIVANLRLSPGERLRHFASAYRNVAALARKASFVDGS